MTMWFQNPARHFIYFYNTIKLLHPLFQNERCITQHIKGTLRPKLSNKIVEIVRYAENWLAPGAWWDGRWTPHVQSTWRKLGVAWPEVSKCVALAFNRPKWSLRPLVPTATFSCPGDGTNPMYGMGYRSWHEELGASIGYGPSCPWPLRFGL